MKSKASLSPEVEPGAPGAGDRASPDVEADTVESWLVSAARVPVAGAPRRPTSGLPPGVSLHDGRFTVVRRLGAGGMGVVYAATDHVRGAPVAIKTFAHQDAAALYRLKLEFRALVDVSHPNLVRLHDLFADGRGLYFSMELIDGVPFDRWVRPDGIADEERLRQALGQMVSAISAIHAAGKAHRDLKPSNVLVTDQGRVVVLDFGLTSDPEVGGVGQTLEHTSVTGTPAYMAPEQAAGRVATGASDVYALGVMFFEALTGRLPFEGRTGEVLAAKQIRDAPPIATLAGGCSPELAALCVRMLARDAHARPTLEEVGEALGTSPEAPRLQSAPTRTARDAEPSLVGRDADLVVLEGALRASIEGERPVVVLVSGESGIGKSALCGTFLRGIAARGEALALSGRCYEREAVPFNAFDAVIDDLTRHLRRLDAAAAAALMPRETWALCRLFPVLGRILAFDAAPTRDVTDAREIRRQAFHALGELFARLRDRQPLVVWVDDLQWADADSQTLLLHLLRQPDAPRLLLLACHRADAEADPAGMRALLDRLGLDIRVDLRRVPLGPLDRDAARALVRDLPEGEGSRLLERARGNPFLLLELAAYLARGGSSPETIEHVLRARIADLPEGARTMLETVAIAAHPLPPSVAAEASGLDGVEAFDVIRALQDGKLLARIGRSDRVHCYHDAILGAVLQGLDPVTLAERHRALSRALEAGGESDVQELAHHLDAAGELDRAAHELVRAAERASEALAFDRAARLYLRALDIGRFAPERVHRLRLALAAALALAGRRREAGETYLSALPGACEAEVGEIQREAALQFLGGGYVKRGCALLDQGLRPLGFRLPRTTAGTLAALAAGRVRLRLEGLSFHERTEADSTTRERFEALERCATALGQADVMPGVVLQTEALRLALESGDVRLAARAVTAEVWCGSVLGSSPERLRDVLARAEALLARCDDPGARSFLHFAHAFMRFWSPTPELAQALDSLDSFFAIHRRHPTWQSCFQAPFAAFLRINTRINQGFLGEGARAIPALLDEIWGRGNLSTVPMAVGWNMALARVGAGDGDQAEHDLRRARREYPEPGRPTWQMLNLFMGDLIVGHHTGRLVPWEGSESTHTWFMRSTLRGAPMVVGFLHLVRAQAALAWALRARNRSDRARLLVAAEKSLAAARKAIPTLEQTVPVLAMTSAALACQRGDVAAAVRLLAPARGPVPSSLPFYAHGARFRLGRLLGGDEGRSLVEGAEAALRAVGVLDPSRFADVILPGYPE